MVDLLRSEPDIADPRKAPSCKGCGKIWRLLCCAPRLRRPSYDLRRAPCAAPERRPSERGQRRRTQARDREQWRCYDSLHCAATLAQRCASHPDFASNALHGVLIQRFLSIITRMVLVSVSRNRPVQLITVGCPAGIRPVNLTLTISQRNIMKKALSILIFALFSTQVFAQKISQEEPWAKTARIIAADEAKMAARRKAQQLREADAKKLEKRIDAKNKKGK